MSELRVGPHAGGHAPLMFDPPEILLAEGAATKSVLPGEVALASIDAATRAGILALFFRARPQASRSETLQGNDVRRGPPWKDRQPASPASPAPPGSLEHGGRCGADRARRADNGSAGVRAGAMRFEVPVCGTDPALRGRCASAEWRDLAPRVPNFPPALDLARPSLYPVSSRLERDEEKWNPVFLINHATPEKREHDDVSIKHHHALE